VLRPGSPRSRGVEAGLAQVAGGLAQVAGVEAGFAQVAGVEAGLAQVARRCSIDASRGPPTRLSWGRHDLRGDLLPREVYRGPVAIILPTAAEHHVRVMGLVRLTRGEAIELVDDALAAAVNNGGDPRVRVRRHSAHTVVDVATVAGWAAHAVDPESFATCKAHEHVDITLHAEPVAGREPLSSRMPRSMPAETGCEVCGAWWLMTPGGSVCVNGHHPRRGWT